MRNLKKIRNPEEYLSLADVILVALTPEGKVEYINRKGLELLGHDSLVGEDWFETCLPDSCRSQVQEVFEKLLAGETNLAEFFENPVVTKSGQKHLIGWRNKIIRDERGQIVSIISSGLDLTRERSIETRFRESQRRLQTLFEQATVPIAFRFEKETKIRANKAFRELFEYSQEELDQIDFLDLTHPEDRAETVEIFRGLESGKRHEARFTKRCLKKNGQPIWVSVTVTGVWDEANRLQWSFLMLEDITEQVNSQQALLESAQMNQAVLDTILEGVIVIDHRGIIESFNPTAEQIFGYQSGEVIQKNVSVLMPKPDAQQHDVYVSNYLRTGEAKIIGIGRDVVGQRKDGRRFPLHLGVAEISFEEGPPKFVGTIRDLSEEKRIEKELQRTREFAALGEMAASVAHQIKNPLAAISGVIRVIKEETAASHPHFQVLVELLQRVEGLDQTIKSLLRFSKPWTVFKQMFDLTEVVETVVASAQKEQSLSRVQFAVLNSKQHSVPIDVALVQDVLWNLIYNAAQSMPEGGDLRFDFSEEDGQVIVTVSDSGFGMESDVVERVFRPFFTTKSDGTGLGLSICRKIMEAHGGEISISSQPGKGTAVRLSFPV